MLPLRRPWTYQARLQGAKPLGKTIPGNQASLVTTNMTSTANYLEIEEDLAKYKSQMPPPKVHLLIDTQSALSIVDEDMCILDSSTSHTILKDIRYFLNIRPSNRPVTTITGINNLKEGHGLARVLIPNRTTIDIPLAI